MVSNRFSLVFCQNEFTEFFGKKKKTLRTDSFNTINNKTRSFEPRTTVYRISIYFS